MAEDSKPYVYQPIAYHPDIQILFEDYFIRVTDEDIDQYREKVTALFTPIIVKVTGQFLDQFPSLKVIGNCGVGYDSIDIKACKECGIRVGNTPNILNDTTADMGMALLLAVARKVVEGDQRARDPSRRSIEFNWYGSQVSGATAGIIGLGRIGQEVAKRMRGFDMKILYYGRTRKPQDIEAQTSAQYIPNLHDMLSQSDYIVLVAPATKETYHMMGSKEFQSMKTTGIFINISRGSLVNQEALVEALNKGEIGGAGLDVTDPEPLPVGHPLLSCSNLVITPHTGSATLHTRRKMFVMTIENILAGLRGEVMPSEVKLDD